jgi:hypothetical protein
MCKSMSIQTQVTFHQPCGAVIIRNVPMSNRMAKYHHSNLDCDCQAGLERTVMGLASRLRE